jgi:ferredoxin-NADP reductase
VPPPPPPGGLPPPPAAPAPAAPLAPGGGYAPGPAPIQESVKAAGAAAPARTIRKMDAVVLDVVRRTPDASTVYFFVGDTGDYKAGQFITIDPHQFPELARWIDYLEAMKGKKEGIRAYSMASAPGEKCVSITVKAEPYAAGHHKYPPLLSPFMASGILKGREVQISGYSGHYYLKDGIENETDQVLHMIAGSGAVPNYGMVKDVLRNKPEQKGKVKHTVITTNKTVADIFFHEQWKALQKAFPDQLEVFYYTTREDSTSLGPNYIHGRPTFEFVRSKVNDPSSLWVYSCGAAISKWDRARAKENGTEPRPKFMESVVSFVDQLGVPKSRFKREVFG